MRHKDGKHFSLAVHRLVAAAFLGPKPEGTEVCHNNGDPTDCRVENLRYDTRSGNQRDRVIHGTSNRGERHRCVKLTKEQVIEIKKSLRDNERIADIARKYGVHFNTIRAINLGRSWWHVQIEPEGVHAG